MAPLAHGYVMKIDLTENINGERKATHLEAWLASFFKSNPMPSTIQFCHIFLWLLIPVTIQAFQVGTLIDLPVLGKINPRHSSKIDSSPWGIQASTLDPELLQLAADIGVKWTRLGATWPSIEKERGVYDWTDTDAAFDAILKTGIVPFVTIGKGNELYSPLTTYDDPKLAQIYGYRPAPPTKDPDAMKAWLRFVKATIKRYKDRISYWEIWNEPNHRNYWGADPDGREYGDLLNQTAKLIRNLQPDAKIIGGSMAGIDAGFARDFLQADTANLIDIITYHNYGAIPETRAYKAQDLQEVIGAHNPNIELWQGECGYPSHSSTRDYRGRAPWGLNVQAKWLLRQAFVDTYFCGATMSNYFKLVHMGGRGESQERPVLSGLDTLYGFRERGGSRVRTKGVNEKCLLTNPSLEPKPGYFAYQNLCAVLDGRYKIRRVPHQMQVLEQGVFYGIGAEDDAFPSVPLLACYETKSGKNLLAYWLPWNAQEYLPELASVALSVEKVGFEEPILLDPISGNIYDLPEFVQSNDAAKFDQIPLADYPLIIAEQSEVEYK